MAPTKQKLLFITVGTTKFEKLIGTASSEPFLNAALDLGFTHIVYQTGSGSYKPATHPKLHLEYKNFFENFHHQIDKAHLIISHGGAGSCLEVLRKKKPLIVVVNEDLMENHQVELAEELKARGYLDYCNCNGLVDVFSEKKWMQLSVYPDAEKGLFGGYVDKCMGFA